MFEILTYNVYFLLKSTGRRPSQMWKLL